MFAIASQTVSLIVPGEDAVGTITFSGDGGDVSQCTMTMAPPHGASHVLRFNRHGQLIDQQHLEAPDPEAPAPVTNYMIDGRDTRADNPYTHVAPNHHGDPIPLNVGHHQPDVFNDDGSPAVTPEMREKAHADAKAAAEAKPTETDERPDERPGEGGYTKAELETT